MTTNTPPGAPQKGLGWITGFAHLLKLLEPHFLPASYAQPPAASLTKTGDRIVALSTRNDVVSSVNGQSGAVTVTVPPIQRTSVSLAAGTVTWTFSPAFNSVPIVEITPVGAPPSTSGGQPATVYISSVVANEVIIDSTVATDTRTLHLTATGNPN